MRNIFNETHKLLNKNYSNSEHTKELQRHRWYFFKEGFSPLVVEEAIQDADLRKDDLIVDPFSGSGTVPLVSTSNGFESVGFEVNPFLSFVAKTKQDSLPSEEFIKHKDNVLKGIQEGQKSKLECFSTFSEESQKEKWLFNTDVLRAFEGGWAYVNDLPPQARNLYRLALLDTAMDNANASKDGKCLRYKKKWKDINYNKESFTKAFLNKMQTIEYDLDHFPIYEKKAKIIPGDSRKTLKSSLHKPFRLCVTSPPYLNSFDYSDIYRPELFIGKFVKDNKELRQLRLKTIRSHIQANWAMPRKSNFGYIYKQAMDEIIKKNEILWDKRIPFMIQAYFEDMEKIFSELKFHAHKDASFWLIVSTSAYAGIEVPVDLILADIGSKVGWNLREIIVTRYLRHSTQNAQRWLSGEAQKKRLRESIVVFKGHRK